MAGVTGLEPAASGVTGRRSNRLSYTPNIAIARARVSYATHPAESTGAAHLFARSPGRGLVGDDGLEPPTLSV